MEEQFKCHDCGKEIKIDNEKNLIGGKLLKYKKDKKEYSIFKCDSCYKRNKSLGNFQETEVYSRVVGYYRPLKQWNPGKQQEYKERQEFKKSRGLNKN